MVSQLDYRSLLVQSLDTKRIDAEIIDKEGPHSHQYMFVCTS